MLKKIDIGNIGPTKAQGNDKQNKAKIQLRKSNETYVSLSLLVKMFELHGISCLPGITLTINVSSETVAPCNSYLYMLTEFLFLI